MPNINDMVGADVERKFMDVIRILFQIFRDFGDKLYDAAKTNDALKTYYKFMDKFEEHYDLNTGELKKPGEKPPFDISKCQSFATKEIMNEFRRAGVDYMMVSHEGLGTVIVTPSDDLTRTRINQIKAEAFIKNSVSARITSADLFADNAGRDIVRFEGFTATQVAEFDAYAKEQGFLFAAPQNENGTYTIEISKFTAEQPALHISEKVNEMISFNSKGMEAELDSLYANRKASIIDNAIAEMRAIDPSKAPDEKIYVVDAKNPTHYIAMSGDAISVSTESATTSVKGQQAEQVFFNETSDMEMPVQVSESQFRAMYAQDALSPAARMQFAKDSYNLTKSQMNSHLLGTMEQRLSEKGIIFDVTKAVTEKMKVALEKSDKEQDKRLLSQIQRTPLTEAQIRAMIENGDSVKSGCINDLSLGRNFNDAFSKAVESIVAEQVMTEKIVKDILKENKEIDLSNISPEIRASILNTAGIEDPISVAMAEKMMDDISNAIVEPKRPEIVRASLETSTRDIQDIIDATDNLEVGNSETHFNNEPSVQFSL